MSAIDAVTLTQELIRFDTRNPPGSEAQCAAMLADLLSSHGLSVTVHNFGSGRSNLVARFPIRASKATQPPILFTGHIDTVPLGLAAWSRDPFGAEIVDGRLYGRGSTDMKAGVAAMVAAVVAEADRLHERSNVVLVITGGEETGCEGAAALVRGRMLDPASLLVVGEPTGNSFVAGHKGALWLRACCSGRTAHGAMPHLGDNAIYKAARAVTKLESFGFNAAQHPVLGSATLNVGTIAGGLNINSVPDHAELTIDVRTLPEMDSAALADQLSFTLGSDCKVSTILDLPAVWSDPKSPAMKLFSECRDAAAGWTSAAGGANFFTDASVFTPALGGVETIICGPGDPEMAHKTDEYCEVARIGEAVEIYRAIIARTGLQETP
ncbi:M20 family metallopeptidase [Mesorhizobium sp. YR577]|uniref:M20 family metallopeptidase n=1 Tax=Mesorhizobium sp. YR577 TaxID=1884373 RepID=UPI0008EEE216|nr:M20 family metallopeptidase [Mesorhizobium sp. YR577]SFU00700.1 succinyl-diaminopimelate desuccinylase [Mesorhizobium sp. YR577]